MRSSQVANRYVVEELETRRLLSAPSGTLDPSFGSGGVVVTPTTTIDISLASIVQQDGKIVCVREYGNFTSNVQIGLFRYNRDGSLDNSFGSGGEAFSDPVSIARAYGDIALAQQLNGDIVMAGTVFFDAHGNNYQAFVARYTTSGGFDTTFAYGGSNSSVVPVAGQYSLFNSMVVDTQDRIVVDTSVDNSGEAIERYTAQGLADSTFGSSGIAHLSTFSYANIALADNGDILTTEVVKSGSTGTNGPVLVALTSTGSLDSSFGSGGSSAVTTFGYDFNPRELAIGHDAQGVERITLLGNHNGPDVSYGYPQFFQFGATGSLLASFDVGQFGSQLDASDLVFRFQSNGQIVGLTNYFEDEPLHYIFRLNVDGSIDTTFGNGGIASSTAVELATLQLDTDGKIILTGLQSGPDSGTPNALAQFTAGEYAYTPAGNTTGAPIEAENYDQGGEGVAYHDSDTTNGYGQTTNRQGSAVDVYIRSADSNGQAVGLIGAGEYTNYTVNVPSPGKYNLMVNYGTPVTNGSFELDVDGTQVLSSAIASTGDYFNDVSHTYAIPVQIAAGQHVFTLKTDSGGGAVWDVDYFELAQIPFATVSNGVLTIDESASAGATTIDSRTLLIGKMALHLFDVAAPAGTFTFSQTGITSIVFAGTSGADSLSLLNTISAPLTYTSNGGADALSIAASAVGTIASSSGLLKLAALNLGTNAKLDLNNNDLLLDYTGTTPQAPTIAALINTARAGGAWTGNGLASTSAKTNTSHDTTLGAMEATDYKSIYGNNATFDGQTIDTSAVLVKYTYYGDADFNGQVNFDDYSRIDKGYTLIKTGWVNGDFNENGAVNFDDYSLIDTAYTLHGNPFASSAAAVVNNTVAKPIVTAPVKVSAPAKSHTAV